jgi:hypothetical protein
MNHLLAALIYFIYLDPYASITEEWKSCIEVHIHFFPNTVAGYKCYCGRGQKPDERITTWLGTTLFISR